MNSLLSVLCVVALLVASPARSEGLRGSPLIGSWAVDIARLPVPPEARPKRVTITFAEADDGRLSTSVQVEDASGSQMNADAIAALDGTPTAVSGNLEADTSAVTMPIPQVLVMQLVKEGVPASTRVYAVSDDGESMIETASYVGADRQPVMRTNYFSRVH